MAPPCLSECCGSEVVSRLARAWRLGQRATTPSGAAPLALLLARNPRGEGNPRGRAVASFLARDLGNFMRVEEQRVETGRWVSVETRPVPGPCACWRPGQTGQPVANDLCLAFAYCAGEGGASESRQVIAKAQAKRRGKGNA